MEVDDDTFRCCEAGDLIHSSYLNDNLVKHVNPIIKVQSLIRFAHEHSVSRI